MVFLSEVSGCRSIGFWPICYNKKTVCAQTVFKLKFSNLNSISGITIRFLGEANTRWSATRRATNSSSRHEHASIVYRGHEKYFQTQYYLLGGKNSKLNIKFIVR